jgi:hypothetical protein
MLLKENWIMTSKISKRIARNLSKNNLNLKINLVIRRRLREMNPALNRHKAFLLRGTSSFKNCCGLIN